MDHYINSTTRLSRIDPRRTSATYFKDAQERVHSDHTPLVFIARGISNSAYDSEVIQPVEATVQEPSKPEFPLQVPQIELTPSQQHSSKERIQGRRTQMTGTPSHPTRIIKPVVTVRGPGTRSHASC